MDFFDNNIESDVSFFEIGGGNTNDDDLFINFNNVDTSKISSGNNINDINTLDNQLNELQQSSNFNDDSNTKSIFGYSLANEIKPSVRFDDSNNAYQPVSSDSLNNNAWDTPNVSFNDNIDYSNNSNNSNSFNSFNNSNIYDNTFTSTPNNLNKQEQFYKKYAILKKIELYEESGVKFSKKYTIDSDYDEMFAEFSFIDSTESKKTHVDFYFDMLSSSINTIESLNQYYDPFGINLDGWGASIEDKSVSIKDNLADIYEKYKDSPAISPEIKLLGALIFSGVCVHVANSKLKSEANKCINSEFNNNPELAHLTSQALQQKLMQSHSQGTSLFSPSQFGSINTSINPLNTHTNINMTNIQQPPHNVETSTSSMTGLQPLNSSMTTLPPPIDPTSLPPPPNRAGNNDYATRNYAARTEPSTLAQSVSMPRTQFSQNPNQGILPFRSPALRPDMLPPSSQQNIHQNNVLNILNNLKQKTPETIALEGMPIMQPQIEQYNHFDATQQTQTLQTQQTQQYELPNTELNINDFEINQPTKKNKKKKPSQNTSTDL